MTHWVLIHTLADSHCPSSGHGKNLDSICSMEGKQEENTQKEVNKERTAASARHDREEDAAEDISVKQVDRPRLSHGRPGWQSHTHTSS